MSGVLEARALLRQLRAYDARALSVSTGVDTGRETIVQQQFVDEVDVNTIVRRFGLTSERPAGVDGGVFGDFTDCADYESAVAKVERAREGFLALPAAERERFGNDPGRLIAHLEGLDDAQLEAENVRLGLVVPPVVSAVVPVVAAPVAPVATS